jgi:DNA uptake protein ComE-like DNA-binding protein
MAFKGSKMKDLHTTAAANRRTALAVAFLVIILGGCTSKSSEQQDREVQQKSAQATATVKQGAQETVAETKDAADQTKEKLDAVAAGVKEGWNGKSGRLDLNAATVDQVATLPGIGRPKAEQIVKGRPYGSTHDLVARGMLSESQYERISTQITAR